MDFPVATRCCILRVVELFLDAIEQLLENEAAKVFLDIEILIINGINLTQILDTVDQLTNFLRQLWLSLYPRLEIFHFVFNFICTHSIHFYAQLLLTKRYQ